MKIKINTLLCLIVITSVAIGGFTACSSKSSQSSQEPVASTKSEADITSDTNPSPDTNPALSNDPGIDLDLTMLSSTMVYSEVYNMMAAPDDYIGKTIKMNGAFAYYHDEDTGNDYFACIISDATACCSQGIEFELAGDYVYPDDYPSVDQDICLVGQFDTYMEGNYRYCILRNAKFV
ncbi:MAG: hypothetical protein K5773_04085 [Pseudobutyrivibrio sp.]|nr:hypothetical protein [Pseudobutyrivibrio sp.]